MFPSHLGAEQHLRECLHCQRRIPLGPTSIDAAWKLLIPAAIAATYTVVEKDPQTGLMSRLALTVKQRDEILKKLRSDFGADITEGMKAGQISLVAAASVLYEVLWNQHRKTRGEK